MKSTAYFGYNKKTELLNPPLVKQSFSCNELDDPKFLGMMKRSKSGDCLPPRLPPTKMVKKLESGASKKFLNVENNFECTFLKRISLGDKNSVVKKSLLKDSSVSLL